MCSASGDSGGPLECLSKGKKYLCGVVSRGAAPPNCGIHQTVFVKVTEAEMIAWLEKYANAEVLSHRNSGERTKKNSKFKKNNYSVKLYILFQRMNLITLSVWLLVSKYKKLETSKFEFEPKRLSFSTMPS